MNTLITLGELLGQELTLSEPELPVQFHYPKLKGDTLAGWLDNIGPALDQPMPEQENES